MFPEIITDKSSNLRVVVSLASDVLSAKDIPSAKENLENEINKLIGEKNYPVKFDLIWCDDQSITDDQPDWSRYFYYETPIPLIEKINEIHKPDLIICVFWKIFGLNSYFPTDTTEKAQRKSEEAAKKWTEKDFPQTKVVFCKQNPKLNEEDKKKRLFISYFRSQVDEDVLASCNKNQIPKEIEKILSEFIKSNFNEDIEQEQKYEPSPLLKLSLPDDWLYLNKWLNENSALIGQELDENAAINFFNGKIPSLTEALSSSIPRRAICKDLLKIITKAAKDKRFAVTLLLGPGGEGKSTILQQVAIDLIRQRNPEIQVIFRQQAENLTKIVENLNGEEGNFVIVSDDAQNIAKDLSNIVKRVNKPNNIQFLLASRTTHWEWERNVNSNLQTHLGDNFVRRRIGTLDERDAKEIVKAWEKANALGKLKDEKEPVKRLLDEASLKADKSGKQNSFFSAILWVRKHQTLDARVKDILNELNKQPSLNGKKLDYYYNYIIALHGDGISILTNSVLQEVFGCDEIQLKTEVLDPLVGETAILQEGALVLARHHIFAERAKELLKDRVDFNNIIGELAVAAEQLFRDKKLGDTENDKWLTLKDEYFVKRKQPKIALAIVKAIAEEFVFNPILVTRWVKLLRAWGENLRTEAKNLKKKKMFYEAERTFEQANEKLLEASNVLLKCYDKTRPQRSYFTEWGVIQGEIGNSFFSAWLTSISLIDDLKERRNLAKPNMMELASLATAFSKSFLKTVHNKSHSDIFKKATEGAVRLGFDKKAKKNIDFPEMSEFRNFNVSDTERNLQIALEKVKGDGDSKISLEDAFQFVLDGINLAWELCEIGRETLPESLPNAPDLKFNKLKKLFGIKENESENETSPADRVTVSISPKTVYKENKFPFFYDRDADKICDAEGLAVDLSDTLLDVLKQFFRKDGQNITNQLTFAEVAENYKKELNDNDDEVEIARNFQRNLRDQLKNNYGLDKSDEIIKTWRENGYQLGSGWDFSKTRKYIDAIERPTLFLNENIAPKSDRKISSVKPSSD